MLEKGLCPGEHESKSFRRVERLLRVGEAAVGDAYKGGVVGARSKQPLYRGRLTGSPPLNKNAFVGLDGQHIDLLAEAVYLPIPANRPARPVLFGRLEKTELVGARLLNEGDRGLTGRTTRFNR